MKRYFGRKLLICILTFFVAVTIDWMIPRFMPGNPVDILLARAGSFADWTKLMHDYYTNAFGLDLTVWQQYLNFWNALLHGDMGTSVYVFPLLVTKIIMRAVPFDIFLLVPSILLSWLAGNWFGAFAARSKQLDIASESGALWRLINARKSHRSSRSRSATTLPVGRSSKRMVKLGKISKIYRVGTFGGKELHEVSDVSFDVEDGEVVSIHKNARGLCPTPGPEMGRGRFG